MRASSSFCSSFSSPWPDPNSPVLAKINFGVPVSDLLLWLDIRDTFLGHNGKKFKQDIRAALARARDCKHPDAVWLTSMFEGKEVSTKEEARKVFLLNQDDARALCFAWALSANRGQDLSLLQHAAEMGYAFAVSKLSTFCARDETMQECFRLIQVAAAQHERNGYFSIGLCLLGGIGCEKNLSLAKENLLIAAELGVAPAAAYYGKVFDELPHTRWLWLGRAALHGSPDSFLDSFSEEVETFLTGSGNATVMFLIGRGLKGNVNVEKKEIFGSHRHFDSLIGPANQAFSFYDSQIKSARLAVDTWTLVATRLHIIKDMRVFIGKMIWEARFEANYKISARALRAQKRSRK